MGAIKKIVVPVDFSTNTDKVVEYAISVADQLSAQVCFLHVNESFSGYDMLMVHTSFAEISKDMKIKAEARMANLVEDHESIRAGCSGKVVSGDVADEIVTYAESEAADLIVIGTHGVKGLERVLIGSVADQVVKKASCPVLTFNPFK